MTDASKQAQLQDLLNYEFLCFGLLTDKDLKSFSDTNESLEQKKLRIRNEWRQELPMTALLKNQQMSVLEVLEGKPLGISGQIQDIGVVWRFWMAKALDLFNAPSLEDVWECKLDFIYFELAVFYLAIQVSGATVEDGLKCHRLMSERSESLQLIIKVLPILLYPEFTTHTNFPQLFIDLVSQATLAALMAGRVDEGPNGRIRKGMRKSVAKAKIDQIFDIEAVCATEWAKTCTRRKVIPRI